MTGSQDDAAAHPRAATLEDVADRAGVSRQTVSNVVNGTGRVGDGTRRRVLAAIDELGFIPHRAAASLRTGRVRRLAYLLPDDEPREDNTILLDFLQHLVDAAAERGQQVLVVRPDARQDPATDTIETLVRSRSVDAIVLSAVRAPDARVRRLQQLGASFACFGRTGAAESQCWVDVDNAAGTRAATEAAIAHGHTAIAFAGYRSTRHWDDARREGYEAAMAAAGLPARITVVDADRSPTSTIGRLLRPADRPTAIVTGSDVLAAACYGAARRAGLAVGTDLSVVGFDGTTAARLLSPTLATVRIPLDRIARTIVERLLGDVANDAGTVLAPQLAAGESLGPPVHRG